ncbi:UPAR/Ly6 domain-containing protein bou-like [Watersipora subatra]|uniref:UPAR/Ly6 domain-containing protein bou-like n=1 Tax=Watersipora subatra TaxID=2589382 RepID=UPI00355B78A2
MLQAVWPFLLGFVSYFILEVDGIGCYMCQSINGSNPRCEDTFNSHPDLYQSSCFAAKGGDILGTFPATTCLKLKATKDNYTVFVRDCTLDRGGITKDVEIGALDHCGWIRSISFDGTMMRGCLTTCEHDGCNSAATLLTSLTLLLLIILSFLFI